MLDSGRLSHRARHPLNRNTRWAWVGRLLAACVLALLGAGQTLPGLHHLLIRHAVCAEHGDLTHATGETAAVPVATDREAVGQPAARSSGEESHDHEHCSLPALGADPSLRAEGSSAEPTELEAAPAPLPALAERAQSSLDLLALAPKLAPPV